MSEDESPLKAPPALPNYGNTCYINAIMQLIMASPALFAALQKDKSDLALWDVLNQFLERPDPQHLYQFISCFKLACIQFNNREEQDSLDFFNSLLMLLRRPFTNMNLYKEFSFSDATSELSEFADYCVQRDFSYTAECLSFYVSETSECQQCHKTTFNIIEQEALILDGEEAGSEPSIGRRLKNLFIKESLSINDLIEDHLAPHKDQRACECGNDVKMITRRILRFPELLIVIVRRTHGIQPEFIEKLTLNGTEGRATYEATTAVVHHQIPAKHYTAIARYGEEWFICDDDHIGKGGFGAANKAFFCAYQKAV